MNTNTLIINELEINVTHSTWKLPLTIKLTSTISLSLSAIVTYKVDKPISIGYTQFCISVIQV